MKNVKTLLIFITISTFIFASQTRVNALGGAGFWADDYANIEAFPASVNNHNVAWTDGNDFTSVWNSNGTTWGFAGGTGNDDVVNMMWGNGTYGVTFGLGMSPEIKAVAATDVDEAVAKVDAETTYELGFGMPLAGMDFGFGYDDSGTIGVNLRRAQEIWEWDNMLINFEMTPEKKENSVLTTQSNMNFGIHCYTNRSYDNGTTGLFALGFAYGDMGKDANDVDPDATMNLVWNFAVESAMTDWATLRVGYNKAHDFGGGTNSGGGVVMGLGFNYGSFDLDCNISTSYNNLLNDPVKYVTGRNDTALGAGWTISYNW